MFNVLHAKGVPSRFLITKFALHFARRAFFVLIVMAPARASFARRLRHTLRTRRKAKKQRQRRDQRDRVSERRDKSVTSLRGAPSPPPAPRASLQDGRSTGGEEDHQSGRGRLSTLWDRISGRNPAEADPKAAFAILPPAATAASRPAAAPPLPAALAAPAPDGALLLPTPRHTYE